jgi:hypothetical protein
VLTFQTFSTTVSTYMNTESFPDQPGSPADPPTNLGPSDPSPPPDNPPTDEPAIQAKHWMNPVPTVYSDEREWPGGLAATALRIYQIPGDPEGRIADLDLIWTYEHEGPHHWNARWNIRWSHTMGYFQLELPRWLAQFCPAPKEVLETLRGSLPPELAKYFEDKAAGAAQS